MALKSEFETACPCCQATLVIDVNLRRVVRHVEPVRGDRPELSDAHRILADEAARREARFRRLAPVSLEGKPPPEPFYDDDESFWEWYQPDDMTHWEDLVAEPTQLTPDEVVDAEERLRSLAPRERLVYLLHDMHRLTPKEVAQVVGVAPREVLRLLERARRHTPRKRA